MPAQSHNNRRGPRRGVTAKGLALATMMAGAGISGLAHGEGQKQTGSLAAASKPPAAQWWPPALPRAFQKANHSRDPAAATPANLAFLSRIGANSTNYTNRGSSSRTPVNSARQPSVGPPQALANRPKAKALDGKRAPGIVTLPLGKKTLDAAFDHRWAQIMLVGEETAREALEVRVQKRMARAEGVYLPSLAPEAAAAQSPARNTRQASARLENTRRTAEEAPPAADVTKNTPKMGWGNWARSKLRNARSAVVAAAPNLSAAKDRLDIAAKVLDTGGAAGRGMSITSLGKGILGEAFRIGHPMDGAAAAAQAARILAHARQTADRATFVGGDAALWKPRVESNGAFVLKVSKTNSPDLQEEALNLDKMMLHLQRAKPYVFSLRVSMGKGRHALDDRQTLNIADYVPAFCGGFQYANAPGWRFSLMENIEGMTYIKYRQAREDANDYEAVADIQAKAHKAGLSLLLHGVSHNDLHMNNMMVRITRASNGKETASPVVIDFSRAVYSPLLEKVARDAFGEYARAAQHTNVNRLPNANMFYAEAYVHVMNKVAEHAGGLIGGVRNAVGVTTHF